MEDDEKGEKAMKIYEVRHRCGSKLLRIDENYQGGAYAYCKKCHKEVLITKLSVKNKDLIFIENEPESEPEPITECYFESQSQNQSQLVRT